MMRTVIRSLLLATFALPLSLHAAISGTPRQVVSDSCGVSDWQTAACQVTLSGASLSANDLIVVMMSRNDDSFTALCPTEGGYTLAQNNGGGTANSVGGAICWKKASGSETTITGGIATGQSGQITAYVFSGTDLDLSSAASNQDNNNGAATTKSSSAASNTEATGLGVAMFATDDGIDNNVTGLTNSWVDLADSGSGSGVAESFAASKVLSSAASQETTATITSDQAWGTILVFNGAPAVSIDGTARQTQTDTCGGSEWETTNCRVTLSGGTLSANDLIVVAWSRNDDTNTTPVLPTEGGYTLGDSYSNGYAGTLGCAWAWKKASGSETTITPSWSSIVQPGAIAAAVFPGGGLNLAAPEAKAENETNVAGASTSISSGTVSNVTANALGLAAFCADNGANNATAYSNSWNEQAAKDNDAGVAPIWITSKVVSSVASQETVATITSNEAYGAIAFFGGTGGALPETCASGRTPVLITDTSSASDTDNLLYGLGVTANQDTVCLDTATALGKAVTLDADGYVTFASAGSMATDSVGYTVNDNGAGEGSAGSFEMTFQPVIDSVTGTGTGQTTGTVTVTPAGPTEGTVRIIVITKESYDTYGPPTDAQINAGTDANGDAAAWNSSSVLLFDKAPLIIDDKYIIFE